MHTLIQELQHYHHDKARHLNKLQETVDALLDEDRPNDAFRELQSVFAAFQGAAEAIHHHNEELILRELRTSGVPIHRRVDEIADDHAALDRVVAGISGQIGHMTEASDALRTDILHFVRIYDDHATGEESIFFPFSDEHLGAKHWLRIEKDWRLA